MENNEFEEWYDKANEEMPIPLLENSSRYHQHREEQWIRLQRHIGRRRSAKHYWRSVAASILFLGLLATTYLLVIKSPEAAYITYTTQEGETSTVELPDGSTLYLYEATTVRRQARNWDTERTLDLQEGHFFVDVKPDPNNPFQIDVDTLHIRVLGTSFWVRSYDVENEQEVTVQSGRVEVRDAKDRTHILHAGEKLTYSTISGSTSMTKGAIAPIGDEFVLIYYNEKLSRILFDLQRRYGIKLSVEHVSRLDERYTVTFDRQLSLDECLTKLRIIGDLEVKKGEKVTANQ